MNKQINESTRSTTSSPMTTEYLVNNDNGYSASYYHSVDNFVTTEKYNKFF